MTNMTDAPGWLGGIGRGGAAGDPRGYRIGQEVERAASVARPSYPRQTLQAIDQLAKALDSGMPLRKDVPRGFYLNITA
jgi:hypothetical protein